MESWEDKDFAGCKIASRRRHVWDPPLTYAPNHLRQQGTGRRRSKSKPSSIDVDLAVGSHVNFLMARLEEVVEGTDGRSTTMGKIRQVLNGHVNQPFMDAKAARAELAAVKRRHD